ncbi:hypothetical protein P8452_54278 [Trifolium repens]|nr:hypothetical protein P8452_54278 [Trifolium repens]
MDGMDQKLASVSQEFKKKQRVKSVGNPKLVKSGGNAKVGEQVKSGGNAKVGEQSKMAEKNKVVEKSAAAVVEKSHNVPVDNEVDKSQLAKSDMEDDGDVQIELPFDPVKNVTKKKEIWRLGVFLEDLFTVYKGDVEDHMELLLRDIKGDTIQAFIMQTDIAKWKPKLSEGKTYNMRNFRVAENDASYKMSPHKYRLQFVGATRVAPEIIRGMPQTAFTFKDFSEIQAGKYRADLLVDAIGVIISVGKCVTATATKKGSIAFTIKDLRDNVMDCTLWDALSVEFMNFYNTQSDVGRIVLILKHARVKEPQGSYPLQLTNAWNGTKLLFDEKIPEIKAFLESLPKDVAYMSQKQEVSNSTPYYSQTTAASQFSSDENFLKQARVVTLGEMKKLKQDTFCVTVVTTSHIRVSNQGWYFFACPDCNCKAEGFQPPYVCKKGHKTDVPNIKYKVDVEVYDGDETAKFVFWDNTLEDLIGMNAATLLEKEKKKGLGDPQDYPEIFNSIMDRTFAFRVKWTSGWGGQASVSICKDSKELVAKIQEQLPVAESIIKEVDHMEEVEEPADTMTESPKKQNFTPEDIDKFACLDDSILSTPNVSGTGDNANSASSHKTPAKRSSPKHSALETAGMEIQFSSTRAAKLIKKEKI